ncbi:MAG: TIGR03086 family protein [Actinobacteria bacterium]|nr:TIGR03086 family protein [Actinomycetota bacterium]
MAHDEVSPSDIFVLAVDEFDARVKQVKDDQWVDATPCTEWNVRDLINHIVNEARWVPPLLAGKTIAEVGNALDGDLLGSNPHEAWDKARDEELQAVKTLGALDQKVHVSWGDIPAGEYLAQVLMDHVIHAWDLARAIGADDKLDDELVEYCYDVAKPMEEMLRGSGLYGNEVSVADDAGTQKKLLALVGRTT